MTKGERERVILDFLGGPMLGWEQAYLDKHGARFDDTLSLLPPAATGDRLLDVGVFPGQFAALARSRGYAVDGIGNEEMTDRFLACANRAGFGIHRTDVETMRFPMADNTYHVVVCTEILEHLYRDPFNLLSEAFRVLAPGGSLILTTPNLAGFKTIFRLMGGESYRHPIGSPLDETFPLNLNYGHYREYTMKELGLMLSAQDKRLYRYSIDRRVFSLCWDDDTAGQALRRITHPLWCLLTLRNWLVSRMVPPWRSCLMIRARKPETACWIQPSEFSEVSGLGPVEEDTAETGFSRRRLESPFRWTIGAAGWTFKNPAPGAGRELLLRLARLVSESDEPKRVCFLVNGECVLEHELRPTKHNVVLSLPLSREARQAEAIHIRIETEPASERGVMLAWERMLLLG
jgi:SAM-dependent methyltransferase